MRELKQKDVQNISLSKNTDRTLELQLEAADKMANKTW
jgi:hypothetical protein